MTTKAARKSGFSCSKWLKKAIYIYFGCLFQKFKLTLQQQIFFTPQNMLKEEEDQLVERLRDPRQCRKAFGDVIAIYSEPLYWHIRKMVISHDDANDLLQNTFMKAWASIENFRGEARLSTWLYKIAINESITFLNKERQRLNVSIDDGDTFLADKLESDEWFDGDDLKKELQKAIAQLPEKQRLIFNMRYFDDMKYENISEILGTSVGALKASFHHAVKKIEKYFS